MKNISIIETKTGRVVATNFVSVKGLNYTPSENEEIAQAWDCAVEGRVFLKIRPNGASLGHGDSQ